MKEIIKTEQLSFAYSPEAAAGKVLKELSFTVHTGERVGIIGCNGVGKSTLLKLLLGIELSYEGELFICGLAMEKKNLAEIRRHAGYVFQDSDSQLFMATVFEDVCFAPLNYGCSAEEAEHRAMTALKSVHGEALAQKRAYQLSGGEKKLAAIAGVLAMEPELLVMDEPSAALDPANRQRLVDVLLGLPAAKVIASHDLDFIYDTCDRAILLCDGRIAADGEAKDILRDEALLKANGLMLPLSFSRGR
ncbi:MAG: energy-coupling factor ABC transporter ATP-binding protein [Lachnospiraceae bacterium]|nr:energy-coupling factor ABC transporter ATP-binding protein [Lachnospiraceae bacterium]